MQDPVLADTASTDAASSTPITPVKRKRRLMADYSNEEREAMVDSGEAMPDKKSGGKFPIRNQDDLEDAIEDYNRIPAGEKPAVKRHIVARAKALNLTSKLPDDWNVSTELSEFHAITLEFDPSGAVMAEGTPEGPGVMRVKVPFYVGNSTARVGGFDRPMYFPADTLPGIVQEARKQLDEGKQPLTVYARHSHAATADQLPIGRVAEVMTEGDRGYAVLEIAPVGLGLDVQGLVRAGMLNAVSLRSRKDYELENIKLDGEPHYAARKLPLAGIDFAPDGPAQPTYGMHVLNEEPRVEPDPVVPDEPEHEPIEQEEPVSEITLEAVRARADIVSEIEKPHKDRIAELEGQVSTATSERDEARGRVVTLETEVAKAAVERAIDEVAARFPDAAKAREVLAEVCKDATSRDAVYAKATPILLDVMTKRASADVKDEQTPPAADPVAVLAEQFAGTGKVVKLEGETGGASKSTKPSVMGLEIPA